MSPRRVVPLLVVLGVGGFLVYRFVLSPPPAPEGDLAASGTVEATDAQLGFQIAGRLVVVAPREGERVAAGAELARLDDAELLARRDQALAQVAAARALVAELQAGSRPEEVAQARAGVAAAGERVGDAERDVERATLLYGGKAVSREALDKATFGLELARRQREQASEQLRLIEAGPRQERIDAARAQLAQAEAVVATLDVALANTRLLAPFAGLVTVRHREPGEIVAPGTPVVTLLDPADRWVRIYVPENRLGKVAIGEPATIRADTFPDKRYAGEVAFIASEAEFTPKNVQTTEERVRLVYAVKVRVVDDAALELKPGLPADVWLGIRTQPGAPTS